MSDFHRILIKSLKARYRLGGYLSVEDLCILSSEMKKDLLSGDFGECAICGNTVNRDNCYDLACGHYFHDACIRQWIKIKKGKIICPLCKQETVVIQDEAPNEFEYDEDDNNEEDD